MWTLSKYIFLFEFKLFRVYPDRGDYLEFPVVRRKEKKTAMLHGTVEEIHNSSPQNYTAKD